MSDTEVDVLGRCPVCREKMVNMGKFVICPKNDYRANLDEWDRRWVEFDIGADDADELLGDLLDLNLQKNNETKG